MTADRAAVRAAVGNLLANAVRLAPTGSTITVGCGQRQGWAFIAVRDEGPGITSAEQPLVFERYWQGRYETDRRRARPLIPTPRTGSASRSLASSSRPRVGS